MTLEKWAFTADYIETCNCAHGCPCNTIGIPTDGFCEAIVAWHIQSGHYGSISLDGLNMVAAWSWPGAIHDGDGTAAYFVTSQATRGQREAVTEILMGRAGGQGPFEVFAGTFTTMHEPEFVEVAFVSDGKEGWFQIPDVLDVQLQGFTQPWDGQPATRNVKISFDKPGLIFDWAILAMTRVMRIFGGGLNFDHSGRNAFYTVVNYQEQ